MKATNKSYRFFFHYNKPESRKSGIDKLTLHYRGQCHIVEKITCGVPTETKNNKSQPRIVVQGLCLGVDINGNYAVIK